MSEITDKIKAYADTGEGFDELVAFLAGHTYVEAKRYDDPNITALDERDWDNPFVEGSWDEVSSAHDRGELTHDEYAKIAAARHAAV